MNWENPPPEFQYILFERIEPDRYYYLAFVPRRWRRFGGGGQKFHDLSVAREIVGGMKGKSDVL